MDKVRLQFTDKEGAFKAEVVADIADTPDLRRRGLSKRAELPAGSGMFFDTAGAYWMKDVNFPLDIVFLDKQGSVLEKQHMPMLKEAHSPRTLHIAESPNAVHAIELPAGWFDEQGLSIGDKVRPVNLA